MPVPAEGEVALISGSRMGEGFKGTVGRCVGREGEIRAPRASPTRTHAGHTPRHPAAVPRARCSGCAVAAVGAQRVGAC